MNTTQQPEALVFADSRPTSTSDDLYQWAIDAEDLIRAQHARIEELEAQLSAIGAGGVEPLRKRAAAQQAVQAEVPEAIEQMAVDRYKVVPSHESMFHRWAVVAGNGTQQLYIGREGECQSMARKFMGAFLDGAFVAMQNAAPAHPAEGVPQAITDEREAFVNWLHGTYPNSYSIIQAADLWFHKHVAALAWKARAALAATQPAAQGLDAETQRHAAIGKAIERACMDLPDGTEISVSLEKDAGTVTLIDQDGNEYENFSCDYGFAGVLNEAIDAAMAAHARNKKGIEQ